MKSLSISLNKLLLGILISSLISIIFIINPEEPLWITVPFILPNIMIIPGVLILTSIKYKYSTFLEFFLYSIGLSITYWIFGGFIINLLLPYIHILNPLSTIPLIILYFISILFLIVITFNHNKHNINYLNFPDITITNSLMMFIPIIMIILSTLGVQLLNNNGSNIFILILIFLICIYVLLAVLIHNKFSDKIYPFAIWCIGLSLIFIYSLRSSHILGWDINQEFQVFQATLTHEYWSMNYFPNEPYNACLSITILPTIFNQLLHISPEYIFKFIMQIIFAFLPVTIYAIVKRFSHSLISFLTSFVFVVQQWFYEQMPALIRQEIALLFFALGLLVIFDKNINKQIKLILFYLFSFSLILSHYSSAYIWICLLFLGLLISQLLNINFIKNNNTKYLTIWMVIIPLIFIIIWEGFITNTAGPIIEFTNQTVQLQNLNTFFNYQNFKEGFGKVLFSDANYNNYFNLSQYHKLSIEPYQSKTNELYPKSISESYKLPITNSDDVNQQIFSNYINNVILLIFKANKIIVVDIFTLIGIIYVFKYIVRKKSNIHYQYWAISVATIPLIFSIIFLSIFQVSYNITRLFMQSYILLSIFTIIGGLIFFSPFKNKRYFLLTILIVILFTYSSGFTDLFTGGPKDIIFNNQSHNFDYYVISDNEIAGANWLKNNDKKNIPIYADIVARLRLRAFDNLSAYTEIFPDTITQNSYVYLDNANVIRNTAYGIFNNNLITYAYPTNFLNNNKNLIYDTGDVKIYK